jgi:hypothetical protein
MRERVYKLELHIAERDTIKLREVRDVREAEADRMTLELELELEKAHHELKKKPFKLSDPPVA